MGRQPLAEVFGFRIDDRSDEANRHRTERLCPFNNKGAKCNKDKADDPLGVCSIYHEGQAVIICPIRFREKWQISDDAAGFFFLSGTRWTSFAEIQLKDRHGVSAGNIDIVLAAYNEQGQVIDFGALEVQAVYISGNVRKPFAFFMQDPNSRSSLDWLNRKTTRVLIISHHLESALHLNYFTRGTSFAHGTRRSPSPSTGVFWQASPTCQKRQSAAQISPGSSTI